MMDPGTARIERLLQRNHDAMRITGHSGRETIVRRDQVLVHPREADTVDERLRRWANGRDDHGGVARLHLRPDAGIDLGELVTELREDRRGQHRTVSLNHVLHGETWWFGPAGVPSPAAEIPAPHASLGDRAVTAAVIDTGLAPHPWFEDLEWYAAQRDNDIAEVLDADLDYELDNQAGHGTFIAGVILQQAPATRLLIRRVLGCDGLCDEFALVRALNELRDYGDRHGEPLDLINLSLGCHTFDDQPTPVMSQAIADFGPSTVVVACAGNTAMERPFWPAALESVIGVGALDSTGKERAAFSNYGPWVDASAIGEDVRSSFVVFDGPESPANGTDPDYFRGYASWSGTSFAAPAVTGAIATHSVTTGAPIADAAADLLNPEGARTVTGLGVVVET